MMRAVRRDQILPLTVGGVAAAALGTIPLHRLPRPVRIAYVVGPGALTAILTYAAQGRSDGPQASEAGATPLVVEAAETAPHTQLDTATAGETAAGDEPAGSGLSTGETEASTSQGFRLVLSLGLGALVAGAGATGLWMDHRVEDALRSRGVPAPRLVMGLATGVITVVITAFDADETEHATHPGG